MFTMKKILILTVIVSLFYACSVDDGNTVDNFYFQILPIESVNMPTIFTTGNTYQIEYSYIRPSTCHSFNDLYYLSEGSVRTIAVIDLVTQQLTDGSTCEDLDQEIITQNFNFIVNNDSGAIYTFKFWQGVNEENGEDLYLTIEVPVLQ